MHRRFQTALLLIGVLSAGGAQAQQPDGKKVYATTCAACHQVGGEGREGIYPPLVGSEWLADDAKLLRIVLHGLSGPVEVGGETYDGAMPGWGAILSDADIAAVTTYIRSAWGNKGAPITAAKVTAVRGSSKRATPWTVAELAQVIQVKK